jgi:hypothetical protein
MIGQVLLRRATGHRRPAAAGKVDLGYLFLPRAWGFGFAAEACAAALDWFDGVLPGEPVVLTTQTANVGSMRLAARLGFTEVERSRPGTPSSGSACGRRSRRPVEFATKPPGSTHPSAGERPATSTCPRTRARRHRGEDDRPGLDRHRHGGRESKWRRVRPSPHGEPAGTGRGFVRGGGGRLPGVSRGRVQSGDRARLQRGAHTFACSRTSSHRLR